MADQNILNPSRQIGLGAVPSMQGLQGALECNFTSIPVIENVTWTVELPLTDTQIEATFANEIDVLQSPKAVPGVSSVDSSFSINGILQTDMLCAGMGFHAFAEPQTFMQIGNVLSPAPASATATVVSPDVFTAKDVLAAQLGIPNGSTLIPSIMEWGHAAWEAAWHLANGYQLQWIMEQRYQVIKEMVADVCYFGPYASGEAAGTSEVDVQEYARQINDRYRAQVGGGIFVPINARRIGSVNGQPAPNAGATGNYGLFHPTRDFDLAPSTQGGLRVQGAQGCCQPFRRFAKPILVERGIPVGISLFAKDAYHVAQMQRYLSISESQGGNLANVAFDKFDTGTSAASAMPELTLDQGGNQFSFQQVTTSRAIMKGGSFKLAVLLKGVEVWGGWKQYLLRNANGLINPTTAG